MVNSEKKPKQVAVLAFEHISPFHLSVPCIAFCDAPKMIGLLDFELKVCSEEALAVTSSTGFQLVPQYNLATLANSDIVIIPSWPSPDVKPSEKLISAIQHARQQGALLVGLCLGAYVLAAAGVLDNMIVTTHWAYAEDLQQRYPRLHVKSDSLYHQQDNVVTSAGTAAAIDCCLQLVRQYSGSEASNSIARFMVTAPQRTGNQSQFIELPVPGKVTDLKLAELMDEILSDVTAPYTINVLASRLGMSRRTFTRHFRALTGQSVGQWILVQRLRLCQRLLEQTTHNIEQISQLSGFQSVVSLRHHFKQKFGVSPSEWRKTFQLN